MFFVKFKIKKFLKNNLYKYWTFERRKTSVLSNGKSVRFEGVGAVGVINIRGSSVTDNVTQLRLLSSRNRVDTWKENFYDELIDIRKFRDFKLTLKATLFYPMCFP